MTEYIGILIPVEGEVQRLTWDDKNHREHVREGLCAEPAVSPGGDGLGWGCLFVPDPDVHGQQPVNPRATRLMELYGEEGRIYVFGDAIIVADQDEENPVPFSSDGGGDWIPKHMKDSVLPAIEKSLEKDPRLLQSILKLENLKEDSRPKLG